MRYRDLREASEQYRVTWGLEAKEHAPHVKGTLALITIPHHAGSWEFIVVFGNTEHTTMNWGLTKATEELKATTPRSGIMPMLNRALRETVATFLADHKPVSLTIIGGHDRKRVRMYQSWADLAQPPYHAKMRDDGITLIRE